MRWYLDIVTGIVASINTTNEVIRGIIANEQHISVNIAKLVVRRNADSMQVAATLDAIDARLASK